MMIYGSPRSGQTALEFLGQSPTVFHLTGSRFFDIAKEDSDWDYFTLNSPGTETELVAAGFHLDSESYEHDPTMVKVYGAENVHVQLVTNVKMKLWVQYQLAPLFKTFPMNKEQAKLLWQVGFRLYQGGMDGIRLKLV